MLFDRNPPASLLPACQFGRFLTVSKELLDLIKQVGSRSFGSVFGLRYRWPTRQTVHRPTDCRTRASCGCAYQVAVFDEWTNSVKGALFDRIGLDRRALILCIFCTFTRVAGEAGTAADLRR